MDYEAFERIIAEALERVSRFRFNATRISYLCAVTLSGMRTRQNSPDLVPPVETRALWSVLERALLIVYFLGFLPSGESLIGFLVCFLRV